MKCPRCQQDNPPGSNFCLRCGTRLGASCSACGNELPAGSRFCNKCGTPVTGEAPAQPRFASPETYTPKHLAERIINSKAAMEGERKQVTVLFADLKGSMELLAGRDPEEARKILDPIVQLMMEAVHRYEGTVNQVMGDGIMALFGAPVAHEDHAVRACYAALRMQESVKRHAEGVRRNEGIKVRIRVGLNSGAVVVRAIGSDLHMDYTAVGQTTHLAARMEQLADSGTVLLPSTTVALAEDFIQVRPQGPTPVKGLGEPVEIYELVGATPVRSRFHAHAAHGLTTFVGRASEMAQLVEALDLALRGRGQVVAVVGEPGVGKSRLFWEFGHSNRTGGCLVLESASVSYGKVTTYLPVIELLRGYFQIEPRDDTRKIREKVTGKLLSLDRFLELAVSPLLALLDVPLEDPEWGRLDPAQRRQRTLDALKHLFLRESQVQPLVIVFEDLHWIDGETQAVLDGLIESLPTARVLLIVNYRPEYRHSWGGKSYYRQLRVDALAATNATDLLQALLGTDPSLAPLVRLLIERTEGNPLFLEESVRTLVETRALVGEAGAYRLTATPDSFEIPATAQAIIAARIDRLDLEDKRLLQAASVLGKDVPLSILESIADIPDDELRQSLGRLQSGEFLYEAQLFPEVEYTFKHALTHEVAYSSLLAERRRELHATVTATIERLHADRLIEHVERLAHHAWVGEIWDKAARYLRQAGTKAFRRSANREAAACFERALDALRRLPQHPDAIAESVDIRFDLRTALVPLGEWGRTGDLLDEAEALAESLGDRRRLGRALDYKAIQFWVAGDLTAALETGLRALTIGESESDVALRVVANSYVGMMYVARGECREAVRHGQAALALIPEGLAHERFDQATIQGSQVRFTLAMALGAVGQFAEAFGHLREAMHIAEEAGHVYSLLFPLFGLGTVMLDQGDFAGAVTPLERGVDLCRTREVPWLFHDFAWALGAAYYRTGRRSEGVVLMEDAARRIGERNQWRMSWWAGRARSLGGAYLLEGRLADASRTAQEELAAAQQRKQRGAECQLLQLLGDIAAHSDHVQLTSAEANYREALARGETLDLRPLVAHCHLGLGKLYRRTAKREQARTHLITATTLYREMDMRYWLEQAQAETRELT